MLSKVVKSANMTHKVFFFKNAIWVSKNAEFNADFEFIEKLKKTHAEKVINEKVTGKLSFVLFFTVSNFCL